MTVGFDDLSSTRRVPDRDVRKNIKPIYSITSFGDGYESRVSIGTDGREESYDITFNNRPIDEIVAIAGFFENRAKDKTFDFTVPDSSLPAGEKDIVVYCDNYTTTYYNDEVGSIAAKLVRVYELVSGTAVVNITTASFNMNEGQTRTVNVSTSERGPELLYWTLDSATTADFTAVSGSFSTSGTTTLSTGSFDIQTLEDLTTEGPEDFNISVRSGSTGGPVLDQIIVTVQDTSTGPEAFQWEDSGGASLATEYVLQQNSVTLFVGVENYDPVNPLYWTFLGYESSQYSPSTGQINLTGTFASSTGSITLNAPATSVDIEDVIYLRKDSISGPIVDQVTLFTLVSAGAEITESAYNAVDSVSIGPNESPQYEVTVYFKGTLFPIEQIYWTIDGAVAGVDFDQVQGSFLPTGDDNFNFGQFTITKPVPSPEVVEFYTLRIRRTGFTGEILDTVDLVVETTGLLQRSTSDSVDLSALDFITTKNVSIARYAYIPFLFAESVSMNSDFVTTQNIEISFADFGLKRITESVAIDAELTDSSLVDVSRNSYSATEPAESVDQGNFSSTSIIEITRT